MAKKPAFILKDCVIALEGNVRIGQAMSMTIPVLERKTEEIRNAGMVKPREIEMGLEKTEASFTETAFDPDVMKLYGVYPNRDFNSIVYGYLESEDGTEHSARCELVSKFRKIDPGDWQTGEKAETQYELAVNEARLFIDDEEIYFVDDFEYSIGGVVQQPGRVNALRLR